MYLEKARLAGLTPSVQIFIARVACAHSTVCTLPPQTAAELRALFAHDLMGVVAFMLHLLVHRAQLAFGAGNKLIIVLEFARDTFFACAVI
jgi:hypothetical protein